MKFLSTPAALFLFTLLIAACSDDVVEPPATAPTAAFTMNSDLTEGDTLLLTNSSTEATTWEWSVTPGDMSSTEKEPEFVMLDEGTYTVRLIASGEGGSDTVEQTITIGANMAFRAFGSGVKTWYVHSLKMNGTELADDPCYWDNTIVLDRSDSTFVYGEGAIDCQGPLPAQSGTFEVDQDYTVAILHVTEPFTSSVPYSFVTLQRDTIRLRSEQVGAEFLVTTSPREN